MIKFIWKNKQLIGYVKNVKIWTIHSAYHVINVFIKINKFKTFIE